MVKGVKLSGEEGGKAEWLGDGRVVRVDDRVVV